MAKAFNQPIGDWDVSLVEDFEEMVRVIEMTRSKYARLAISILTICLLILPVCRSIRLQPAYRELERSECGGFDRDGKFHRQPLHSMPYHMDPILLTTLQLPSSSQPLLPSTSILAIGTPTRLLGRRVITDSLIWYVHTICPYTLVPFSIPNHS